MPLSSFPKRFYKEVEPVHVGFTDTPTGTVRDPMHLATKTRPWVTIQTQKLDIKNKDKKTLIFADPFFSKYTDIDSISTKLREAREAGFTILVFSPDLNSLVPWNDDFLPSNYTFDIERITTEKIRECALNQYRLTASSHVILDTESMNELRGREKNTVDWDWFVNDHALFDTFMKTTQWPVYRIRFQSKKEVDNFLSSPFASNLDQIKFDFEINEKKYEYFFETLPLAIQQKTKTFRGDVYSVVRLKKNHFVVKVDITSNHEKIPNLNMQQIVDALQLAHLKKFSLRVSVRMEGLNSFLDDASALEELRLNYGDFGEITFQLKRGSLPKIKILDLSCSVIEGEKLKTLLAAACNIEELCISGVCSFYSEHFTLMPQSLTKLSYLSFCPDYFSVVLPIKVVERFILAAPNIQECNLENCKINSSSDLLSFQKAAHLKKLNLKNASIQMKDLLALLKACPNLEEIDLEGCRLIGDINELETVLLTNLKKINLTNLKIQTDDKADTQIINSHSLSLFLKIMPQLETLILRGMNNIQSALSLSKGSLSHLRVADFSSSNISADALESFLTVAPCVERLILNHCSNLKNKALFQAPLLHLYYAALSQAEISDEITVGLLNHSSRLTECRLYNFPFEKEFELLPSLRKISISNSFYDKQKIDATRLNRFFEKTPGLESIDIAGITLTQGDLILKKNSLSLIKEVTVYRLDLSEKSFSSFITAIPNVEVLNFSSLGVSGNVQLIPKQLPQLRVLRYLVNDNEILKNLLIAGPHIETLVINVWNFDLFLYVGSREISLSQLRHISINCDYVDSNESIRKALPKLEEIAPNLQSISFLGADTSLVEKLFSPHSHVRLTNLIKVELDTRMDIYPPLVENIIRIAPNIRNKDQLRARAKQCEETRKARKSAAVPAPSSSAQPFFSKLDSAFDARDSLKQEGLLGDAIRDFLSSSSGLKPTPRAALKNKEAPRGNVDPSFFETQSKQPTLAYDRYFEIAKPALYRLSVWQPDLMNRPQYPGPFSSDDFQTIDVDQTDYRPNPHYECDKGTVHVDEEEGTHIILPSLDAQEKLFDLQIYNEENKLVSPAQYQLQYSQKTNFYQVVLPHKGKFTLSYRLAVPDETPRLDSDLIQRVESYNRFHIPDASEETFSFSSFRECARYIRKKEIGRCELRAIAFYDELQDPDLKFKLAKDTVRIVRNHVHAFVEVKNKQGYWHKLDLGGYPANLKEIKHEPVLAKKETINERTPSPSSLQEESDTGARHRLFLVSNDMEVKHIYEKLTESIFPSDIFIAHAPEDLNLSAADFTADGKIKKPYSKFYRWFQAHSEGVICIDMREFNEAEIARLNDVLDGLIEGNAIPDTMKIVLIDRHDRGYYGPDFRRRVPLRMPVSLPSPPPLLADGTRLIASAAAKDEVQIEIDLFQSLFWERDLVGFWKLIQKPGERVFSFEWQKGKLLTLLEKPELKDKRVHVIFKNPPLQDPKFTVFMAELQSLKTVSWADQSISLPNEMSFYQYQDYPWQTLSQQAQLRALTTADHPVYVLSDGNLLSFIHDPCYEFNESGQLVSSTPFFAREKEKGFINIVCAPGLSQGTLAQLLTKAKEEHIQVRFLTPDPNQLPEHAVLRLLSLTPVSSSSPPFPDFVSWKVHDDVYFETQRLLLENPDACYVDMSCLEASELSRFPLLTEEIRNTLLKTGTLEIKAPLADLIQKLKSNKTVILSGTIPPALYEILTTLALGKFEGEPLKGKLIIVAPPSEGAVLTAITGRNIVVETATSEDRFSLLKKRYPSAKPSELDEFKRDCKEDSFAAYEKAWLAYQLKQSRAQRTPLTQETLKGNSDEANADLVDHTRLYDVQQALSLSPWVMVEGPTGIGKTHFIQHLLPKENRCFTLEAWLAAKPTQDQILVIDEASFLSELSGAGEHFLERFKGLKETPPHFYWKGHDYLLTSHHKVAFFFNPESYGAARSTKGLLSEHAVSVSFAALPDFYIRARLITPLAKDLFPGLNAQALKRVTDPIIDVYRWIVSHSGEKEILITPRQIKCMLNLISSKIKKDKISDPDSLAALSQDVAYQIGSQALCDYPEKWAEFKKALPPPQPFLARSNMPQGYLKHQEEVYQLIHHVLMTRDTLLKPGYTDLGLGGILLEGPSGIGKTHFVNQLVREYISETQKKVYEISTSDSYDEKCNKLRQAFKEGALVIAHEINTSLWPHQLLNNFLMGLDEDGSPAKVPGFMMIATQNPPSFLGRSEEDPALRQRFIKLKLDHWPVYQRPKMEKKTEQEPPFPPVILPEVIPPPAPVSVLTPTPPSPPVLAKPNAIQVLDQELKKSLNTSLETYIQRVKSYNTFEHGFNFFKRSQGINRQINYELAKKLKEELDVPNKLVRDIFTIKNIKQCRDAIIQKLTSAEKKARFDFGIRSHELGDIIKRGRGKSR